jgi:hypothetical protein
MIGNQLICSSTERALGALRAMVNAYPLELGDGGACMICGSFPELSEAYAEKEHDHAKWYKGRCLRCKAFEAAAALIDGICVHEVGGRRYYGLPTGGG